MVNASPTATMSNPCKCDWTACIEACQRYCSTMSTLLISCSTTRTATASRESPELQGHSNLLLLTPTHPTEEGLANNKNNSVTRTPLAVTPVTLLLYQKQIARIATMHHPLWQPSATRATMPASRRPTHLQLIIANLLQGRLSHCSASIRAYPVHRPGTPVSLMLGAKLLRCRRKAANNGG